jgi:hypothetical protein
LCSKIPRNLAHKLTFGGQCSAERVAESLFEHFVEATVGAAQILSRPFLWDEFGG